MEDTELEEGEALYYHHGDGESTIDPDVALSYIDDKVQDVLGHFQKDFEGGVSAENLGAKFGGYGSFLPLYPRPPAWSQLRTPTEVYDYSILRSPNNLDPEASRYNSSASSGSSLAMRPGAGSSAVAMSRVSGTPSAHNQVERDAFLSFKRAKGSIMKDELVQKSENPYEQKILKVRIKVGSDDPPARRNSEIYSGLGLDVSPSSLLGDSPTDSEELSHDCRDGPDESPTSILKMMTSFLLHGGLLSPLSDDLIHFTGKEKNLGDSAYKSLHKARVNRHDLRKDNQKLLPQKKHYIYEENGVLESANGNAGFLLKKENDIDSLACEELVSNALKLPLLSYIHSTLSDSTTEVDLPTATNKGFVRDKSNHNVAEKEVLEPKSVHEIDRIQKVNRNIGLSGNSSESNKASCVGKTLGSKKKEGSHKGESNEVPSKAQPKRGKVLDAEIINPMDVKVDEGRTSFNEYVKNGSLVAEQLFMVGGKKLKGGQTHGVQNVEVLKDGSVNDCISYEGNKSAHAENLLSKSDSKYTQKGYRKAGHKFQGFFRDSKLEQEDIAVASKETSSTQKLKDSELVPKGSTTECNSISNSKKGKKEKKGGDATTRTRTEMQEKFNGTETEKPCKAEEYPSVSSNEKALVNSDANPTVAAFLVKEDWVQCDKCQTWRLLPLGTDPKSLPKKWVCSMLNWLRELNRCSVSEEETTQALRALYQAPASGLVLAARPGTQCKQNDNPGKNLSGVSSGRACNSLHKHQMLGQQALSTGAKKKYKSKGASNRPTGDGPMQFPNSVKNRQVSSKSKSLNGANYSPSAGEYGYQNIGECSSALVDKLRNKQRKKKNLCDNHSAAGDIKNPKMRNKGQSDIDSSRASKKVKTDDAHATDGNCIFDQDAALLKGRYCLSSNLPNRASWKDCHKSNSHSKDSKSDISNNGPLPVRKCDRKSSLKKRKGYRDQDTLTYNSDLPIGHSQESYDDQKKEKTARISRSEGNDAITNKDMAGSDKRATEVKDQQIGQDQRSGLSQLYLNAGNSLKRDPVSLQPSVAATSSSSKISGSCQNKTNFQQVRGSPVESVSSSPLRVSSTDKFASIGKKPQGEDDFWDGRFLATCGPIRFSSDGEDDVVSDKSGAWKMNVTHKVDHNGSTESSVVDLPDRDLGIVSSDKIEENRSSIDFATHQPIINSDSNDNQYTHNTQPSEQDSDEERRKDNQLSNSKFHLKKLGNGLSSHSKDVNWRSKSKYDKIKIKVSDFMMGSLDDEPSYDGLKDGKNRFQEKSGVSSQKAETNLISATNSAAKNLSEISKGKNQSKFGGNNGLDNELNVIANQAVKPNVVLETDVEKTVKELLSDKADMGGVSGGGKSLVLPPSARHENDKGAHLQTISGSYIEKGAYVPRSNVHVYITSKAPKQSKKGEKQNETPPISSRNHTSTVHKVQEPPLQKASSGQAATNAIKEAKDLKHLADRLKHSGSSERTGMYFQSALKFLYGASLLESCKKENSEHNEIQSIQVYSSTAKLCKFCAREYERSEDMAAAALAYKCMEVAYMRVTYLSYTNACRDRNELQTALQIGPPGESPSSSASDVDNLTNPVALEKVSSNKGVNSPQIAGNHGITAQNRSSFMRLLNFAQDVSCAMEATRKAQATFEAANARPGEAYCGDGISSVKVALNFNFQDVDELLRLVRIAIDTISR